MKKDRLSLALERHPDDDLLLAMLLRHLPGAAGRSVLVVDMPAASRYIASP